MFFYRFDHMALVPGNKTAGFFFSLESAAFILLSRMKFDAEQRARVLETAKERVLRAQLMPKRALQSMTIMYLGDSMLPRVFAADPVFGGSLGADPESFSRVDRPDALDWLGDEVDYSPHNVDSPKHALALMLLVQTWCEVAASHMGQHRRREEEAARA